MKNFLREEEERFERELELHACPHQKEPPKSFLRQSQLRLIEKIRKELKKELLEFEIETAGGKRKIILKDDLFHELSLLTHNDKEK